MTTKQHVIFDCELIGSERPVFLVCTEVLETGQRRAFWFHRDLGMNRLVGMLDNPNYTWVGFNSLKFDLPITAAATCGLPPTVLKEMSRAIIEDETPYWKLPRLFSYEELEIDHIDLIETAPGVMISLKTYAGRLGCKEMMDIPFHHDQDLDEEDLATVEAYCFNDLQVTKQLFLALRTEIELREAMGEEYGLDLRSKSDAQVAEAVLRKRLGITSSVQRQVPRSVRYAAPDFIETSSDRINALISRLETTEFQINANNGSPVEASWMVTPMALGSGMYKVGLGGLHSQHDRQLHLEASDEVLISDFDVASYYPSIMMVAGIVPSLGRGVGERFLEEYRAIYERRLAAKRAGDKRVANTLKIVLNGTFGKLGSMYSAFYAPELMLAVTLTGQLNLLCLIHELESLDGVRVLSANTDGVMVKHSPATREEVLEVFARNSARTGFEYEETPYRRIAMKDVNNYMAVTTTGKLKAKGLYASNRPEENPLYLMKNPTMEVCSRLVGDYLVSGVPPETAIEKYTDPSDFVAIRNVKGGGVQHTETVEVDDWELVEDVGTAQNLWRNSLGHEVRRKSRPRPAVTYRGGQPFGRVARWYMSTDDILPITYVGSGAQVAGSEGGRLCMSLPDSLPADIDRKWYVERAYSILRDTGVTV